MPEHFHFLQPLWFLALLPMAPLLWLIHRPGNRDNSWRHACDSHLLPYLLSKPLQGANRLPVWLIGIGWLLAVVALADPVWQKLPHPVYRSQQARVVVLDLSRSMLAADLKPSRLARARYKVADILKQSREGQTGLVVFAGDAFAVSPLTSDTNTILALLKPLTPDLMPVQGSRVDLGLEKAAELFKQAGAPPGDILLIADGFQGARALDVAAHLHQQGYRLSVLGVGTAEAAPVPDGQGGYVRDAGGTVVMPALDTRQLQKLAAAGGGDYSGLSTDGSDLKRLLRASTPAFDAAVTQTELQSDVWQSQGPWLVLALLPLAALAFRRGWLLSLPLLTIVLLSGAPQPAMASSWDDLWQRRDQQADQALRAGDLPRAQALATQPLRRGTADYRAGDYKQALAAFAQSEGPEGNYNRGNALAKLGRYREAVKAYDQALKADPGLEDAVYNKAQLEKLLQEQQQQQQQQQSKNSKSKGGADSKQEKGGGEARKQDADGKNAANQAPGRKPGKGGDSHQAEQQPGQDNANGNAAKNHADANSKARQPTAKNGNKPPPSEGEQPSTQQAKDTGQAGRDAQASRQQPDSQRGASSSDLDTAASEQQQADERWLRRIPDDPGGLLRRKFLYQYSQRSAAQRGSDRQAW